MGFRTGAFCKVWEIEPLRDTVTRCRISVSRKNKDTDLYEQDFGGFVGFVGTACAAKAAKLKERDRIQLGDVDVTNSYDKEKGIGYTNFNVYSFKTEDEMTDQQGGGRQNTSSNNTRSANGGSEDEGAWQDAYGHKVEIDSGEVEPDRLPF